MSSNAADIPAAGAAGAVQLAVDGTSDQSRINAGSVAALGVVALYFFVYPAWRSQFLIEIWFTEGWNAYFQDAAAAGQNIYPPSTGLVVNNYPPLSFYTIGLLGRIFGDNLFVGRALSLICLIVVSFEIFCCVRTLTRSRVGGAIGALWYAALMSHNFTLYVGANDPQLAGEAIMGAGLVLFLDRERSGRSTIAALLIMVAGGFWKHNMIAIPLAAIIWLIVNHGRQSVRPIAISALATISGLAACGMIFGIDFFFDLVVPRRYAVGHLISQIGTLQWSALAALIWLSWVVSSRTIAARFTLIHVPVAFASCILQWCGDKVFGTAEFDLILALGIAVGVTFAEIDLAPLCRYFTASTMRVTLVALLVLRLIATDRQESLLMLLDAGFRDQFSRGERAALTELRQIASIEGDVYCSIKLVCRAAGKPFIVDDFRVEQMIATGEMTQSDLDELLSALHVTTFRNAPATIDTSLLRALRRHP